MGKGGGLQILRHKSWNVYGAKQKARVARDEAQVAAAEAEADRRRLAYEAEARLDLLRSRSRGEAPPAARSDGEEDARGGEPSRLCDASGHFNVIDALAADALGRDAPPGWNAATQRAAGEKREEKERARQGVPVYKKPRRPAMWELEARQTGGPVERKVDDDPLAAIRSTTSALRRHYADAGVRLADDPSDEDDGEAAARDAGGEGSRRRRRRRRGEGEGEEKKDGRRRKRRRHRHASKSRRRDASSSS